MPNTEGLLLGLALAIDASVASFAISLLHEHDPVKIKTQNGLLTCFVFGVFQGLMLWFGSLSGFILIFSSMGHYFHLIVGVIFLFLGLKCFQESSKNEVRQLQWGLGTLLVLALATSIDALAAGVSFATVPLAHLEAIQVGVMTFIVCALFYGAGQFLKKIPDRWLLTLAGLIFIFLSSRIFFKMKDLFFQG